MTYEDQRGKVDSAARVIGSKHQRGYAMRHTCLVRAPVLMA